ncbi:MAG: hypothetical protein A2X86_21945 [Bdellovibrionales bacterium GWA2_49_15]|nr:MAG: hypothetical protein A2X86_21945 [Bdellovibrionales bacterium GWA2_49_15]HAZ14996.1 hypothetical protein [Bdellovibrionales bacterium]
MTKIIIFLFFLSSCGSSKEKALVEKSLVDGNCVQAFEREQSLSGQLANSTKKIVGTTVSYLLTGVGHSADVALTFSGGIVIGVVLCSPIIALEAAAHGDGRASGDCIGKVASDISMKEKLTHIGEKTYRSTRQWRCPNLDQVSQRLRKVASCYDEQGDRLKAQAQLKAIKEQQLFVECLSAVEFSVVASELDRLSSSPL